MCDTLWKNLGNTKVFLKNSDRAANEPNLVVFQDRKKSHGKVHCTYIGIEENADTHACILYKPSWTWGAEMGINEHNVAIGNEAVFTKSGYNGKVPSLIGMDYVRLVLERCSTSEEAVSLITKILLKYGQGGNCGFDHDFHYDNSYLVTDLHNAYIVETSGKEYVIRKAQNHANISNILAMKRNNSSAYANYGRAVGNKEYFTKKDIDSVVSSISGAKERFSQAEKSIKRIKTDNTLEYFSALRTHNHTNYKKLFKKGSVKSVCMHDGILGCHTTGSMLVFIREDITSVWLTGSSTPCISVFKPVYFGKSSAPVFRDERKSLNYWLARERVNRCIYSGLIDLKEHQKKVFELEKEFVENENKLIDEGAHHLDFNKFSLECSKKEEAFIDGYKNIVKKTEENINLLNRHWAKKTKMLGQNVFERELEKRI